MGGEEVNHRRAGGRNEGSKDMTSIQPGNVPQPSTGNQGSLLLIEFFGAEKKSLQSRVKQDQAGLDGAIKE